MSFGTGGLGAKSTKHKINTKSSTEAETVGASDYLPNPIYMKYFLEAQGYPILENYFEQDNESAIKLEKNGRMSAGPKSRHINTRYFWIKDRVQAEGITIRHCPTQVMLADFFTKPLQGSLFRKFRDVLLGIEHVDTLTITPGASPENRVGENPAVPRGPLVTGVVGTAGTGSGEDSAKNVSWSDIAKKPAAAERRPVNGQKAIKSDKFVLRSLSRNNPVNRIKV